MHVQVFVHVGKICFRIDLRSGRVTPRRRVPALQDALVRHGVHAVVHGCNNNKRYTEQGKCLLNMIKYQTFQLLIGLKCDEKIILFW